MRSQIYGLKVVASSLGIVVTQKKNRILINVLIN